MARTKDPAVRTLLIERAATPTPGVFRRGVRCACVRQPRGYHVARGLCHSLIRGGCAWRLVPHGFPPWGTVYYWFRRWRLDGLWQRVLVALRKATRQKEGRKSEPSAAIIDSQSVRIAEEFGGNKGYDAAKCVPGCKRHLLVDISGLLAERVTPANVSDNRRARELLAGLAALMPRMELVWADGAYAGEKLHGSWCTICSISFSDTFQK